MKREIKKIILVMLLISCNRNVQETTYNNAKAIFSPDGSKVVAVYYSGKIIVWDTITYNIISVYTGENDFFSLDFSPDGRYIVYGARYEDTTIFDIDNNCIVKTFPAKAGSVLSVAYSHNGRYIASGFAASKIFIWDIETGENIYQFNAHKGNVTAIEFSPDDKYLVSAGTDYIINIWNLENGYCERQLTGKFSYDKYLGFTYSVKFDKSGNRIISGSTMNKRIAIWNTINGKIIKNLSGHKYNVMSLCFSRDGKILASGSINEIKLWDIYNEKLLLTIFEKIGRVGSLSFHPNGNVLLSAGSNEGLIRLWDLSSGKKIKEF